MRANFRHHRASIYTVTPGPVRERDYAVKSIVAAAAGQELEALEGLREDLAKHENLVIVFGASINGDAVRRLVAFGQSLGIPVKYICLVDDSNSRGAMDMGLLPELGPGYCPVRESGLEPGLALPEMLAARIWMCCGWSAPIRWSKPRSPPRTASSSSRTCFSPQPRSAPMSFCPSASAYEKNGTVTNVCGEVQRLRQGPKVMGAKSDLEILGLIGKEMGLNLGIWTPDKVFEEIRRTVRGYNVALPVIATGGAAQTMPLNGPVPADSAPS